MPLRLSSLRSKKPRHGRAVSGASEAEEYPTASPSTSASFASLAVDDMDAPEEEEEDERPYGIAEWAAGEDPEIDIVFLHGLNGHRENTWKASNGVIWPKDILTKDISAARMLAFGYDSRSYAGKDLSRQTFHGHSTTLLQTLSLYRRKTKTERRPIIFAAHSLGGLVLKNALVHASLAGKNHIEQYKAVFTSTHGILFFGTPHQGGNYVALAHAIHSVASLVMQTNKSILGHLKKECESIEANSDAYRYIADKFDTKFLYETIPLRKLGFSGMVVEKSSAVIQGQSNAEAIEIHKNHREMVRMKSKQDGDYQTISITMKLMCADAGPAIERKWMEFDKDEIADISKAIMSTIKDDYRLPLQLGYKQNSHFTGRERILTSLHEALTSSRMESEDESPAAVVLLGTGGVGKTQLARQYAYKHSSDHTSIAWINSMSVGTIYASFLELARRIIPHYASRNRALVPPYNNLAQHLGMPNLINADGQVNFTHETRHIVVEAVKGWFSLPGNTGWLIIFDNVDDLDSVSIGDFFPTAAENGRILITTRRRECTRFGNELELDVLEECESIKLLQRSCQHKQCFQEEELEKAKELVEKLGHLPLAIDQAGAYLHTMRKPVSSYLPLLHHTRIKATLSRKPPTAVWHYEESVFTTWEVSFSEIQKRNPKSAEVLILCSFFSYAEIQPQMLEKGLEAIYLEAVDIDDCIEPLLSFSLVARKTSKYATASENFSVHRLVHEWARERLSTEEKTQMLKKACSLICSSLTSCEIWTTGVRVPEDWQYERQITPHIESIVGWLHLLPDGDITLELTSQFMSLANVYYYEGRYSDAEKLYLWALSRREEMFARDHADVLDVAQGLATVNRFQGKWKESQSLYERVLQGRKQIDPNRLDTLATVQSLAILYRHKGRLQESIELYKWALYGDKCQGNGIEGQQGKQHPNTIHIILGYAIVLQHQGNYAQSLSLYEEVIIQRTAKLGSVHPDTLTAKHNQGDILRCLGQLDKAESVFGEVLDAREQHLGPEHPDTLRTCDGLANVYRDKKMWEKSVNLYAQAMNGREQKLGFNHADTIATVHHIATSYRMQGKLAEAKVLFLRALDAREKDSCLGPDHLHTLRTIEGLGAIAEEQGEYAIAEKHYGRVLKGFRKQMSEDCPDVVRTVENMARILDKLGRHQDADLHHRRLSSLSTEASFDFTKDGETGNAAEDEE